MSTSMIFAPSHVHPINLRTSGYAHLTVIVFIISSSIAVYFRRMLNRVDQNLLQFIILRLEFEDAQTLSQCTDQLRTQNSSPSQPKCQVENFRCHLQGIFMNILSVLILFRFWKKTNLIRTFCPII